MWRLRVPILMMMTRLQRWRQRQRSRRQELFMGDGVELSGGLFVSSSHRDCSGQIAKEFSWCSLRSQGDIREQRQPQSGSVTREVAER